MASSLAVDYRLGPRIRRKMRNDNVNANALRRAERGPSPSGPQYA